MVKEKEIWKDVTNYEGYYQVSNMGNIRSLDRKVFFRDGRERFYKGKIIDGYVNEGYRRTTLSKDGIARDFKLSQLVAMAFLEHTPNGHTFVVDHKDGDRSNDRVENLRIVTKRDNSTICFRSDRDSLSSKYTGVCWRKDRSKWQSTIRFNGRVIHLGYFTDELEASKAYQSALSKIKDGTFNPNDYKHNFSSKYRGVYFDKSSKKWIARISVNGKLKYLGIYKTELEAHEEIEKCSKN